MTATNGDKKDNKEENLLITNYYLCLWMRSQFSQI